MTPVLHQECSRTNVSRRHIEDIVLKYYYLGKQKRTKNIYERLYWRLTSQCRIRLFESSPQLTSLQVEIDT